MHVPRPRPRFRRTPLARAILHASYGGMAAMILSADVAAREPAAGDTQDIETIYVEDHAREVKRFKRDFLASPKQTAPLINTPHTAAVIPQELFISQGAQNLTEVLRNTPGISFSAGENAFASDTNNFSMRGFDTSGNIFVDGVRDSGNYSRDIFNIEQVEVVKGPATDNGRGGAGGYVNLVTKTPQQDRFIRGTASYGFDHDDASDRVRTMIDLNQPFAAQDAAVRLNLMFQDGGMAGRDRVQKDSWGIAPSAMLGLGEDTHVTVAFQHLEHNDRPDWGVPAATLEGMLRFDAVAERAKRDRYYGPESDFDDVVADAFVGRVTHEISPALLLSNQTRWSNTDRDAVYTVVSAYLPLTREVSSRTQAYARETETISNMTNLSAAFATGAIRHDLASGLEFTWEESVSGRFGTNPAPDTDVFQPRADRAGPWRPAPTETADVDVDTIAVYVNDTVHFNEQWQWTSGVRVEHFDVDINSTTAAGGLPQGPDGYNVSKTTVGGRTGLVYKPVQNASVYAAFSTVALPPGSFLSNPDISRTGDSAFPGLNAQNSEDAKVQRAYNYELGTKWELFDGHLAATAALFYTERSNVAISGKTPGDPASPTEIKGYGKHIAKGIELGVAGTLTERWSLFGGLLIMDSDRRHSAFLDAARREANPDDYGAALRTSGDDLAFTPEIAANLWTTYTFPIGLTLGGGVQYVGDSFAGRPDDAERIIANGVFGELPSYTVLNLLASYQVHDNLAIRFNVDNVTDSLHAVSANWPAERVLLGPPRSYLLSADFRF